MKISQFDSVFNTANGNEMAVESSKGGGVFGAILNMKLQAGVTETPPPSENVNMEERDSAFDSLLIRSMDFLASLQIEENAVMDMIHETTELLQEIEKVLPI